MEDCIFCQVIAGKLPSKKAFENKDIIAFYDINPAADTHILICPKKHITSLNDLNEEHGKLLVEIYQVVQKLVVENSLKLGYYRVLVNGGKAQAVPHLHFHFLGGKWDKFV